MARSSTQQFQVAIQETLKQTHQILVDTAKREHARVMQADPRPLTFTRRVDGVLGASEAAVRPTGTIVYLYPRVAEVVEYAMQLLYRLSPVDSGDYRRSHTIFVDGAATKSLDDWNGKSEVIIANYLPYSRKIEIGSMKMRVPGTDHVYQQAEYLVSQKYGNAVHAVFTYQGVVDGAAVGGKAGNRSDARYPCLRIWSR